MSALTSSDLLDLFGSKPTEIEEEASRFKEMRDQWNEKVKQRIAERNGFNLQVQELITEVQNKKAVRGVANQKVKDLKKVRAERTEIAREKRAALKATKEKMASSESENTEKGTKKRPVSKIRAEMTQLEHKFERNMLNMKEKAFMKKMKELSSELKEAKKAKAQGGGLSELKDELWKADQLQDKAHMEVEEAVESAQQAHDVMSRISDEVDKLREAANKSHSGLVRAKREADKMHSRYIVSLKCLHSMSDLIFAMKAKESGGEIESPDEQRTGVSDIMEQLMSGGTISTDDLMMIQRKG